MPRGRKKKTPLGLDETFTEEAMSLSTEELKTKVARIEAYKQETVEWLKNKEEIVELKAQLKMLTGPGRDTVKSCSNKQKYIIDLLKERGEYATETQDSNALPRTAG